MLCCCSPVKGVKSKTRWSAHAFWLNTSWCAIATVGFHAFFLQQMVELASDTFVCIVDESKLVDGLGGSKGGCPCSSYQTCTPSCQEMYLHARLGLETLYRSTLLRTEAWQDSLCQLQIASVVHLVSVAMSLSSAL